MTKGIVLAGGSGSRLFPVTRMYSKQLVMVYDKPLIYYPLSILMLAGIRDILIISDEETEPLYRKLFCDGSFLGLNITYEIQTRPNGIAEAFIIGEDFIGEDNVVLILGDNFFYGKLDFLRNAVKSNSGATIFGYHVSNPKRFGVAEFDINENVISIEEKPEHPKSNYAVPGLYVYDSNVVNYAKKLKPSARGELEITDLSNMYLKEQNLKCIKTGRGLAWLDTGTPMALLNASSFIGAIEARQGLKIACLEEIALRNGFIREKDFRNLIETYPNCEYRNYLEKVLFDLEQ